MTDKNVERSTVMNFVHSRLRKFGQVLFSDARDDLRAVIRHNAQHITQQTTALNTHVVSQEHTISQLRTELNLQRELIYETERRLAVQSSAVRNDLDAQSKSLNEISARLDAQQTLIHGTSKHLGAQDKEAEQSRALMTSEHMALRSKLEELEQEFQKQLKAFHENSQNIRHELQLRARRSSADYVLEKMRNVQSVPTKERLHDRAIDAVSIENGLILEFGVFSGRTINYLASKREWIVDGFDSFEGLPEAWRDGFDVGVFRKPAPPETLENVRLHIGWFEETLPVYLAALDDEGTNSVSYLHVDCDLYSSTKTIFKYLSSRIQSGTIIVFDEYFNFDDWKKGEFLAFHEFLAESGLSYEYITYNFKHEQAAVRIL